jgi:hypothetical protein
MARTQLTTKTTERLNELTILLSEIRQLTDRAEQVKWEILDSRESGTQTAVAAAYGVRRQAVGQWIRARAMQMYSELPHATCVHETYGMTCPEFDRLYADAQGRCQICGAPADETPQKMLHIDHDASVGRWAVRGLLCSACNTSIGRSESARSRQTTIDYLSSPWYARCLRSLELPDFLPEPPLGSSVETRQGKVWTRSEAGWERRTAAGASMSTKDWQELHYQHGPFMMPIEDDSDES